MNTDPKFPLGVTINRPEPGGPTPILGRPNWWLIDGAETYIEPLPRPAQLPLTT